MKNIIAIMAAGSPPAEYEFYRTYLEQAAYRISVDGGLKVYHRLQILPHLMVGDGDSTPPGLLAWVQENHVPNQKFPVEKDATDTELALDIAISKAPDQIWILGGIGSRLDHTLGNLGLLEYAHTKKADAVLISPQHEVHLLTPSRSLTIPGTAENLFSVIPITSCLEGLCLHGFHWNLDHATVYRGHTLTISNRLEIAPAKQTGGSIECHASSEGFECYSKQQYSATPLVKDQTGSGVFSVQQGLAWVIKTHEMQP